MDTTGTLSTVGYEKITSIDTSDPKTAVITFSENFAPWPDLFGGTTDVLLPAHAFEGTDIAEDWLDDITVSGGPWLLESFSQDQAIFVPNTNYWVADRIPLVDRVVIVPREDTDTEVAALQAGEVQAIFPQPFPGAKDRLVGDISFIGGGGTFMEGLWINQATPDENNGAVAVRSEAVRQAVAYSLDRQQIADIALGSIINAPEVLQCAGWNPTFGDWCDNTDFDIYVQDEAKVTELLEGDGWTRPDDGGLWQKDGQDLVLQWNTVAGNKRREDVQALVTEMTKPFGIGWEIINYDAGELFENRLPVMNFGPVALFANSTSPDPSVVALYDIDGIPTEENGFSGQNFNAYASQEASDLAFAIDAEVDPVVRLEFVKELGVILGEDVPWIPLYLLPNLLTWNTTLVDGPGGWAFSAYSGLNDIYDWTVIG
jgi:peptide/nickel transport system substrate-binding protein